MITFLKFIIVILVMPFYLIWGVINGLIEANIELFEDVWEKLFS